MATSACALTVSLDVIGVLGGTGNLVSIDPSMGTASPISGPLQATAVSFGLTDDLSAAIGVISVATDADHVMDVSNTIGVYLNGYYRLMKAGAISQHVGLEFATMSEAESKLTATTINILYRAAAKVLGPVSLLFDVELISAGNSAYDGESQGTVTTLLETAKVGFSVPIM